MKKVYIWYGKLYLKPSYLALYLHSTTFSWLRKGYTTWFIGYIERCPGFFLPFHQFDICRLTLPIMNLNAFVLILCVLQVIQGVLIEISIHLLYSSSSSSFPAFKSCQMYERHKMFGGVGRWSCKQSWVLSTGKSICILTPRIQMLVLRKLSPPCRKKTVCGSKKQQRRTTWKWITLSRPSYFQISVEFEARGVAEYRCPFRFFRNNQTTSWLFCIIIYFYVHFNLLLVHFKLFRPRLVLTSSTS